MTVAEVRMWGRQIGAVTVDGPGGVASFQYTEPFRRSGIEVAPLMMPLSSKVYRFPGLTERSFHGLPGMLADSLPDKFGNAVIDAWLAAQGRLPYEIDAVERLCYTGKRGMGALEFEPAEGPQADEAVPLEVAALVRLASQVLTDRERFKTNWEDGREATALRQILQVSASAGGARAKALIAWNPTSNEILSGQITAPPGFEYWLLKFDGVSNNRDKELADPQGYGAIEYAYSLMARAAGIHMADCRLLEENGRRHFMTRRFDRTNGGDKLHMQSLGALGHFDFNDAGSHSYEQAIMVIRRLRLSMDDIEEQFRRMAFNIVARNQDDHVKNIAFLMDKKGKWSLSPAFDVSYSYNPSGAWTSTHQMSMNRKRDGFTRADFDEFAETASMKRGRADAILDEVLDAVTRWREFAAEADVDPDQTEQIAATHRLRIPSGPDQ
ncbi:MAG: type II toxin-antitoxin system HipA family toxin [Phycisphaerales bacterium JB037]